MEKLIKSKSFWLSFIFATLVIFIALLNSCQISRSFVDILVIPKSQLATSQSDVIMANFEKIPRTFSFYQKMISEKPFLSNSEVKELPAGKIQKYWEDKIKTERLGKSGILRLTVSDKNRFQSEALMSQAQKTFINSAGLYYNIKEDIDIRILDSLITEEKNSLPAAVILLESAVISLVLVFLIFISTSYFFPDKNGKKTGLGKIWLPFRKISAKEKIDKVIPKAESGWSTADEPYEFFAKKAPAPENLPTIGGNIPVPETAEDKSEKIAAAIKEATPEEVKERLNKLLSGI